MGCKGPSVQIRPPRPFGLIFLSSNGVTGMFCPSCGKEDVQESEYCSQCGKRLSRLGTSDEERSTSPRAIKGRVLSIDARVGTGVMSGEDGFRYQFTRSEWRASWDGQITGSAVEFIPDGPNARDIYRLRDVSSAGARSKSKIAAGLLGIFLGSLGIHKFYLGYTGEGVILLLAGTLGWLLVIPGIIAAVVGIIEGIIYLTKSDEEFDRVYVRGRQAWF